MLVENEEVFLSFDKDKDLLDYFLWKFTDLKMYAKLHHVIKIGLTLTHGQAQAERGFSNNKSLIDDNIYVHPLTPSPLYVLSMTTSSFLASKHMKLK